jgi:hypothetical protein
MYYMCFQIAFVMTLSAGRHVAPLRHIILIPRQVLAHTPTCCVISGQATMASFIVFSLTGPGLKLRLITLKASMPVTTDVVC